MGIRRSVMLLAMLLLAMLPAAHDATNAADARWVRFAVQTIAETGGERSVVSDATVEGPEGTDLTLRMGQGGFSLTARLTNDLDSAGVLRTRVVLDSRRAAGTSERGLPLFEEDLQEHVIHLDLAKDDGLALLPFGEGAAGDRLMVEVRPTLVPAPEGNREAPRIRIGRRGPGGWIKVEAERRRHLFDVDVVLTAPDGRIARGTARVRIEESGEVLLARDGGAVAHLALTVERVIRECPTDSAQVRFDVVAGDRNAPQALAQGWAGIGRLGDPLEYRIAGEAARRLGAEGTLRITVRPVEE